MNGYMAIAIISGYGAGVLKRGAHYYLVWHIVKRATSNDIKTAAVRGLDGHHRSSSDGQGT